jgi:hypothetical protein
MYFRAERNAVLVGMQSKRAIKMGLLYYSRFDRVALSAV